MKIAPLGENHLYGMTHDYDYDYELILKCDYDFDYDYTKSVINCNQL